MVHVENVCFAIVFPCENILSVKSTLEEIDHTVYVYTVSSILFMYIPSNIASLLIPQTNVYN